jgi:LysM repeat protein
MGFNTVQASALSTTPSPIQNQTKANVVYTVKRGDRLYKISKKTGTSIAQLMKLNNLHSNLIFPGQQLKTQELVKAQEPVKL